MIRCLIVDDEPIAIRVLSTHLKKIPDVEIVATSTSAVEALQLVKEEAVDLVFLDIEMPALSGLDFVEALARPPRFVFTTAHRNYAVRGFELDAVDYLLKPIAFPRLLRAVDKYRRLDGAGDTPQVDRSRPTGTINIQVDRRTVRLQVADITYIESLSDYVLIHTTGDRYTTKMRISELEEELRAFGFVRIHRSYVAPIHGIDSFTATDVQLGDTVLPISRTYRKTVEERLREGGA